MELEKQFFQCFRGSFLSNMQKPYLNFWQNSESFFFTFLDKNGENPYYCTLFTSSFYIVTCKVLRFLTAVKITAPSFSVLHFAFFPDVTLLLQLSRCALLHIMKLKKHQRSKQLGSCYSQNICNA
jgi:hypothetical protein